MTSTTTMIVCAKCEKQKAHSELDGDFCQECFDSIEHNRANIMQRARAARGYFDHANGTPKMKMIAFLSIFHPEMSERQIREMTNHLKDY